MSINGRLNLKERAYKLALERKPSVLAPYLHIINDPRFNEAFKAATMHQQAVIREFLKDGATWSTMEANMQMERSHMGDQFRKGMARIKEYLTNAA